MKKAYRKLLAGLLGLSMICTQGMVANVFAAAENFSDIYYYDFEDSKLPGIEGISNEIVAGYDSDKAIKITGDDYGENEGIVGLHQYVTIEANKAYTVGARIKPVNMAMEDFAEAIHLVVTAGGMEYFWYPKTTELADGWYAIEFNVTRAAETEFVEGDFYLRMGANNLQFIADDFYIAPKGLFAASGDGIYRYNYAFENSDPCGLTDNDAMDRQFMYEPGYTGAGWKLTIPAAATGVADLYGDITFTTNTEYKFSMKVKSLNEANSISAMGWTFLLMGSEADAQNDQYLDLTKTPLEDGWYLLESNVFTVNSAAAETTRQVNIRIWDAQNYQGWEFIMDDLTVDTVADQLFTYNYTFDDNGVVSTLNANDQSAKTVINPGFGGTGYAWQVTTTADAMSDLYIIGLPMTRGIEYTYSTKIKLDEGTWDDFAVVLVTHGDDLEYAEKQLEKEDLGNGWYKLSTQISVPAGSGVAQGNLALRFTGGSITYTIDDWFLEADMKEDGLAGEGIVGGTLSYTLPAGEYYYFVMGSSDGENWASLQNGTTTANIVYTVKASDAGKYIRFLIIDADYTVQVEELDYPVFSLTVALPNAWSANMTPIVSGSNSLDKAYIVALAAYKATGEMTNVNLYTYSAQDGLVAQGTPAALSDDAAYARAFVFESFANLKPCCDYAEIIK